MPNKTIDKTAQSTPLSPAVVALADGQNINIRRYSQPILDFISRLGKPAMMRVYYPFRKMKESRENQFRKQGWDCVSVSTTGKNALDNQLIREFKQLSDCWVPNILVLIANDRDYGPMVKATREAGCRVIIIGRRGCISRQLQRLVPPQDIYYVEDLPVCMGR